MGPMGSRVRRRRAGGDSQEVEVAEGVRLGLELGEEGDEGGGVGAQGVAVRLLQEAVELRQLLRTAGQALDVRHQGLRRLHHCRRCRRRRRREVLRLRCGDSPGPGLSASVREAARDGREPLGLCIWIWAVGWF
jgi:hypothetical protein